MTSTLVGERRDVALLTAGIAAGPLFVTTIAVQAGTRVGFDPAVHPLSLLSLGPNGWIQVANFVVSGLLAVAGAVGVHRALPSGPASRWGPVLIGAFGVALVWGGVFPTDPADGFPPGTDTSAQAVTWQGVAHSLAPAVAGLALIAACLVLARRFARERRRGWSVYSVATVVVYLALSSAAFAVPDFRLMLVGGSLLWLWPSVLAWHLLRRPRDRETGTGR